MGIYGGNYGERIMGRNHDKRIMGRNYGEGYIVGIYEEDIWWGYKGG